MAQRHQELIDDILGEEGEAGDQSLRTKAWNRAEDGETPRTLTPWEWLEWYEAHGVPEQHAKPTEPETRPWWRRWF